jgi:PKHD-type hydroxylase
MKKNKFESTTVWPFDIDNVETWAYYNNVFSKDECEKIIDIGINKKIKEAVLEKGKKNKKIRDSKTSWLFPTDELKWAYKRITDVVLDLNDRFFKFNLYGFIEGFQFTYYKEPAGKYEKHVDRYLGAFTRKLSLSIQLSDPNSYKGGDLLLHSSSEPTICPKEQGKLILFPSYVLHEVKPVTKGERYSLVAWITGPQFK